MSNQVTNPPIEPRGPSPDVWELLSEEDKALVMRVEAEILDFYDQQQAVRLTPPLSRRWWWFSIPVVAAAALFFVFLGASEPPPLQMRGVVQVRASNPGSSSRTNQTLTLAKAATISDPQGWRLRSHGTTPLVIRRSGKARSDIHFRKGAVSFYVRPGSMKRFVVHCRREWSVVVKGTKFLVWQNSRGVRVEVFRGHVLLTHKGRERLHLYKGQGVYLPTSAGTQMQTYPLSVHKAGDWLARIEKLAQKQPSVLYAYVRDLQRDGLLTSKQRLQVLETAAHGLRGAKRWSEAARLWREVLRWSRGAIARQTALFNAAESCRQARLPANSCVVLYKRLLREFPKGLPMLRESVRARLMTMDPLRQKHHAQRYLTEFPQGSYVSKARSWLQKGREKGQQRQTTK